MKPSRRGFRFSLEAPLLQAGWDAAAAQREVAEAHRALEDGRQQAEALRQRRSELLVHCAAVPGGRLDVALKQLQLRGLAEAEARLAAAVREVEVLYRAWRAAVACCARRQQRLQGLEEVCAQQRATFDRQQGRLEARRADDDWLMRRRIGPGGKETL